MAGLPGARIASHAKAHAGDRETITASRSLTGHQGPSGERCERTDMADVRATADRRPVPQSRAGEAKQVARSFRPSHPVDRTDLGWHASRRAAAERPCDASSWRTYLKGRHRASALASSRAVVPRTGFGPSAACRDTSLVAQNLCASLGSASGRQVFSAFLGGPGQPLWPSIGWGGSGVARTREEPRSRSGSWRRSGRRRR